MIRKRTEVLVGSCAHPRIGCSSSVLCVTGLVESVWGQGPCEPQRGLRKSVLDVLWTRAGNRRSFSLSMSALSLLAISQSLLGCKIRCKGFVTLTISHGYFIEMEPKETYCWSVQFCMWPWLSFLWLQFEHLYLTGSHSAPALPVSIIRRCTELPDTS